MIRRWLQGLLFFALSLFLTGSVFAGEISDRELIAFVEQQMQDRDPQKSQAGEPEHIGLELEGLIHKDLGIPGVANDLVQFLADLGLDAHLKEFSFTNHNGDLRTGYRLHYLMGEQNKRFEIKEDRSIVEAKPLVGFEISSPVVENPDDMKVLEKVVRRLKDIGAKALPENLTGMHVHVSKGEPNRPDLAILMAMFAAAEAEILDHYQVAEVRRVFNDRVNKKFVEAVKNGERVSGTVEEFIEQYFPNRKVGMNLQTVLTYGSREGRFFNSTFDWAEVEKNIDFARDLVRVAASKNPVSVIRKGHLLKKMEATPAFQCLKSLAMSF